ncbi:tRNA (adenosine(37)-N6)-threonylcarbamoyltransferase complex ATPase subunit type 1 TsaE [Brevibacillus sp. SYP-B805]|uniref:tRNA (adenosine(37)-N6)-threonylcarbamoyltransferase complex ATPase subunit type 1 TsaE n=1 Tax=Brevibacillus sp. SYP-B805 TaxID=1578199 RepID=UPI0013EC5E50|nr:tRNA (adenosine(37)-N6)-threonylcarbamoyltransferase complex ATPase subunit type 1 TsaE [Brevibacillus sp. SYP-B805]NGQ96060.1 tRNA (adenosine(37)-N6)-threonylcarbamoyltransferase complex ATPase subunit type 1 TsaE [Brevibacillus sp. SYP-B805]
MSRYLWTLHGEEETRRLGERLAAFLQPGDVLALEGDLGAGKTTFTQGLARGLGVRGVVNSPTFTLIKEYAGKLPLYHMDVYRVGDDVASLGLDDYLFGEGVCVVEWASLIEPVLPPERLTITLTKDGEDSRICRMEPAGRRYIELCERLGNDARTGD